MRRLGRKPPRYDPRTLRMASYVRELPSPPPARDWTLSMGNDFAMHMNDQIGCCAIAAPAHLMAVWASETSRLGGVPSDDEILDAYSDVGGYPQHDQGCDMLSVCTYWRQWGIGGIPIAAFVKLDHDDIQQIKVAINLFGGIYVGAAMPLSARTPGPWIHGDKANSWGGHAMACVNYDRFGVTFITWGRRQRASWSWFLNYVDEAYCCLGMGWLRDGEAPNGFDLATLRSDLASIDHV